ncbi:MAG: hypothetical protein JO287_00325 [Pseudonocardiales bacterium]|nr:hypothetical protein [Pseudonocardiales bacterium]
MPAIVGLIALLSPARLVPAKSYLKQLKDARLGVPHTGTRLSGLYEATPTSLESERGLIQFIDRHASSSQRIFSDLSENSQDWPNETNDVSIYYLAARRGVSRFMQFDPGLTSRSDIQRQIIGGLERWRPPVIVVDSQPAVPSPADLSGSRQLDRYVHVHYQSARRFGPLSVDLRR